MCERARAGVCVCVRVCVCVCGCVCVCVCLSVFPSGAVGVSVLGISAVPGLVGAWAERLRAALNVATLNDWNRVLG